MAAGILGWLFVAATVAAFTALLIAGFWRRYPSFCVLLMLQAWQGAAVNLADLQSMSWWVDRWMPVEYARLTFAALATLEVLIRITREMEPAERWGMRAGALLPVIAARFAVLWLIPATPDPLAAFLRIREGAWIALSLCSFMLVIFLLLKPLPLDSALRWHIILFTILMSSHAFIAPLLRLTHADWVKEQAVYRTIAAGCCMAWAAFVARSTAPAPAATHRESR
jgi:hypothetical protein